MLIAYAVCILLIQSDPFTIYSFDINFSTPIIGYSLAGIVLVLTSKMALLKTSSMQFPFEFLAGLLLVVICNSYFIAPDLNLGKIFSVIVSYELHMSSLFLGAYICLFIILSYRYLKALKAQKSAQSAPHSDKAAND